MSISLAARNVSHHFGNVVALEDVSIEVLPCGGQRQGVGLARSMAAHPGVTLLDEPFGALDAISRAELQESFDNLRRDLAVTTLLVTYDLAEAGRLADEVVVMRKGRIEQRGTMRDLVRAPATEYVARLIERARAGLQALRA